jgi:hypothetical protein
MARTVNLQLVPQVNQFQMMLGINICSILFTGASLLQSGEGVSSWYFLMRHDQAAYHIFVLSVSSVSGAQGRG